VELAASSGIQGPECDWLFFRNPVYAWSGSKCCSESVKEVFMAAMLRGLNSCPDTVELCAVWPRAKLAGAIEQQVLGNTALTTLSARNRVFEKPEPGPAMLLWVLEASTDTQACLKNLDLSGNEISGDGARALRQLLEASTSMRCLTLRECDLSATALEDIAEALTHNKHLEQLDLSGNPAGVGSVKTISEMLTRNSGLRDLRVRSCFRQPALSLMSLLKLMERPETLADAARATSGQGTASREAGAGRSSATAEVALPDGEAIAASIGRALELNTSLQSLDLRGNPLILTQGGNVFVEAMRKNTTLQTLKLAHCELREGDAHALAGALTQNQCLRYLDISTNNIGIMGAEAMARMLEKNTCLQSLIMHTSSDIKADGLVHIGNALAVNTSLHRIDMIGTNFESAEAWAAFQRGLSHNTTLKTLQVDCPISAYIHTLMWPCTSICVCMFAVY
jgi:hypothetical protein